MWEFRPFAHPVATRFDDCGTGIILEACERLRRRRRPGTVVVEQEGNDQENDHELDYREKFLDVFMPRHFVQKDAHWAGCRYWTLVPSSPPRDPMSLMPEVN